MVQHAFPLKGCDVRVLEKSPGEYYTRDEIEQVKFYFFDYFFMFSARSRSVSKINTVTVGQTVHLNADNYFWELPITLLVLYCYTFLSASF